jgi:hypothetical protein
MGASANKLGGVMRAALSTTFELICIAAFVGAILMVSP